MGDSCSGSTENCSLEALVSLLDWDAARRDGYNTSLQLATVQVPVGFTEVPALLGWAMDNWQLESYVEEQWSVLTMREVSQHHLASWLGVVTDRCDPTQVRWVVLLPSCWIECTRLLGIMGQSKITVGCPFRQGLFILVRFWVAPIRVMAVDVTHVCSGMHKSWKQTLVPVLTGRFVDIGDSESSNLNDVTEAWWRDRGGISDITTNIWWQLWRWAMVLMSVRLAAKRPLTLSCRTLSANPMAWKSLHTGLLVSADGCGMWPGVNARIRSTGWIIATSDPG